MRPSLKTNFRSLKMEITIAKIENDGYISQLDWNFTAFRISHIKAVTAK